MKCNHVLPKVSEGKTEKLKVCAKCNKILKRVPKSTIQPKDVAVVFSDGNTGKAYARVLTDFETTLVLAQLQALDDDKLNAREVEPFILRSVKK